MSTQISVSLGAHGPHISATTKVPGCVPSTSGLWKVPSESGAQGPNWNFAWQTSADVGASVAVAIGPAVGSENPSGKLGNAPDAGAPFTSMTIGCGCLSPLEQATVPVAIAKTAAPSATLLANVLPSIIFHLLQ